VLTSSTPPSTHPQLVQVRPPSCTILCSFGTTCPSSNCLSKCLLPPTCYRVRLPPNLYTGRIIQCFVLSPEHPSFQTASTKFQGKFPYFSVHFIHHFKYLLLHGFAIKPACLLKTTFVLFIHSFHPHPHRCPNQEQTRLAISQECCWNCVFERRTITIGRRGP
jgi:hypothetical protein